MDKSSLKKYPVNFKEINGYLRRAKKDLLDAKKILPISEEASFKTTYDAMVKTSLSLMMVNGWRLRTQAGHHIAMVRFVEETLGKRYEPLIRQFDKMRKKRNLLIYQTQWVSKKEASEAIKLANEYLEVVMKIVEKRSPQRRLF